MPHTYLALDVGGTKVLGALVGAENSVLASREEPSGGAPGAADPGLVGTATVARALLQLARERDLPVAGIGAGFPEYVRAGRLTSAEVLDWQIQPADLLAALAPGTPVAIESDVRCGALAEFTARRAGSLYYVSWGTGLSGTFVICGECVTGRRGEAIALGELDVATGVDPDHHGNLESYASGAGIAARYRARGDTQTDSAAGVFAAALAGDAVAADIICSAGRALGRALAWVVALLDPEILVLGGGIGSGPGLAGAEPARTYHELTGRRPFAPDLLPAYHGSRSGLIGATEFARRAAGLTLGTATADV